MLPAMLTYVTMDLPPQEVVDVVGAQCLALLDTLPSGGGIMAGHSWLAEAGGDGGNGDSTEDAGPPPSLPSLAAARQPAAASATPALAAAAPGSRADAVALMAAVARGQDAREAARGTAPAAPQRQEAGVVAAAGAVAAAAQGVQPQPPQPQPLQQPPQQQEQQQQAGPALPPRPASESVGTQADAAATARAASNDGSESDANALRRIENWAKLQVGLALLSVPALLLGVWLRRQ
jgi:hypothetical protein